MEERLSEPATATPRHSRVIPLLSALGALLIRVLYASLRVRHARAHHADDTPQFILAFWHECVLMSLHSRWRVPTKAIISRSKDGEIVAGVLERYGAETARGSSSRGGEIALREVLRDIRSGKNISLTPDGPKGPRRVVKEGVVFIAQASGLPIVPFHFTAKRKTLLRSWDRHIVPMPFSRALYVYGEPIVVPRDGDAETWRVAIEIAMNALADEAEREFDTLWASAPRRLPSVRNVTRAAPSATDTSRENR